jgi:hypothetical protein
VEHEIECRAIITTSFHLPRLEQYGKYEDASIRNEMGIEVTVCQSRRRVSWCGLRYVRERVQ